MSRPESELRFNVAAINMLDSYARQGIYDVSPTHSPEIRIAGDDSTR